MDKFSYACGVMDAFNEVVKAGVKKLALSHPFTSDEDEEALIAYGKEIAEKYGNHAYVEPNLLITDLFPYSANAGKTVILFYRNKEVLNQYLELKKQKEQYRKTDDYKGENRKRIAVEFGRLLSYSDEAIETYLTSNQEKED